MRTANAVLSGTISSQRFEAVARRRAKVLTALNAPDAYILAIVEVADDFAARPRYVRSPFVREPDFGATSVTYRLADLLARAEAPS